MTSPRLDEPAATARITVNGATHEVSLDCTLDQLVASRTSAPSGVAAAVNDTVVPRPQWPRTPLAAGDRVEILTAVQGG